MQSPNDDNDWGDLLPSLEETLELLPELRETAEALGNLRTNPNNNDLKSSGHPGPPTSRAIAPVRTPPYNRALPSEPSRRLHRSKPDLRGLYTPRRRRNTYVSSKENKPPSSPNAPHSNALPRKGSYRAAMAEARLVVAEKKPRLEFTRANESDSDREFRGGIVNSTALDKHKFYALGREEEGNSAAPNSAQQVEKNSSVHLFPFVESSQSPPAPRLIGRKRGYMGRAAYLSTSESSDSADDTRERSHGAKLSTPWKRNFPRRKTTARRSASPPTSQTDTSYREEAAHLIPEAATENFRPRRKAAVVAMERARGQLDDPFPGLFAPRRVNRLSTEQKALMPKLRPKKPVAKVGESASEEDEISRPATPVRNTGQEAQIFYKMESIDPDE